MTDVKVSIITITLNSERYLEQTIQSVLGQTYPFIEYIIIDGASTDGTADLIAKYKENIDHFLSESDSGIADAMNKGIGLATGDYLLFLHSDDYLLADDSIEKAIPSLQPGYPIVLFDILLEKTGRKTRSAPRGLNWWMNFKSGVHHQSAFCAKSLFDQIGNFDTRLRIAMDYDFFLRAYRKKQSAVKIPVCITVMRQVGISAQRDWENLRMRFGEERQVQEKNCTHIGLASLYKLYWLLYLPYRRLVLSLDFILRGFGQA